MMARDVARFARSSDRTFLENPDRTITRYGAVRITGFAPLPKSGTVVKEGKGRRDYNSSPVPLELSIRGSDARMTQPMAAIIAGEQVLKKLKIEYKPNK